MKTVIRGAIVATLGGLLGWWLTGCSNVTPAMQQAWCKVGEQLVQAFVPIPVSTANQQAAIMAAIDAACAALGGVTAPVATPAPAPVPGTVVPPPVVTAGRIGT